jgi:branched-chain amino acid transport system permease protein
MSRTGDPTRRLGERIGDLRPNPIVAVLRSAYPVVLGLIIALVLQAAIAPMLGPFYAKLLLDVGIAIVLAASLNIVNGFGGQFSLGHAGFMMVGGYAAALITYYGSIKLGWIEAGAFGVEVHGPFMGSGDLLFLFSCVFGGVVAALAGLIVGLPSLRLRGDYLAIVTLGFGEIVRVLVQQTADVVEPAAAATVSWLEAMKHLGGPLGFTGAPTYVSPTPWLENAAGEQTGHAGIFFAFAIVAMLLIACYRLKSSSKGRALLAVRENEIAAEAMGVNTSHAKVVAFVTAAFFAGVGGALFAHEVGVTLNPRELGFQKSIDLVIMVVLGGMGSITGAVVAAVILTWALEGLRMVKDVFHLQSDPRMVIYAILLIVLMRVRPQGLLGYRELWHVWGKKRKDSIRPDEVPETDESEGPPIHGGRS